MDIEQNVLQNLLDNNPRFRMLYEEHMIFEKQLAEYDKKSFLSPQEEVEKSKVKKMKLVGKDEMERMIVAAGA